MLVRLLILFAVLAGSVTGHAQTVVYEGGTANPFARSLKSLLDKGGPPWFPNPSIAEPDGSVVGASGDYSNADVCIVFPKALIPQMVPKAIALVHRLGLPEVRILIKQGRVIGCIDLEFNKYIKFDSNRSSYSMPLGMIVEDIHTWGLPEPMGVFIERTTSNSESMFNGKPLTEPLLLAPNQVPVDARLNLHTERHWYGLATLFLFVSLLGGACTAVAVSIFRTKPKPIETEPERPKSLSDAQLKYEKNRSTKWLPLFMMAPMLVVATFGNRAWMDDMFQWVPPSIQQHPSSMMSIFVLPFGAMLVSIVRNRRGGPPRPAKADDGGFRMLKFMFIPMGFLFAILLIQNVAPQVLWRVPLPVMHGIIWTAGLSGGPIMVVCYFVFGRKGRVQLAAGDADYDTAKELGKAAGITVRQVQVRTEAPSVNAFAGLFGTVGLTQGFRDRLSPNEKRAIIAHEIGHLKGRHVPWLLAFSLAFVGVITLAEIQLRQRIPDNFAPSLAVAFSPITLIFIIMLIRGPLQRQAEHSADRFALQTIGDFDQVAGALAKIHLLNASPHTLRTFDAAFASHPSLTKRLEVLRQAANEMGWNVPENAVQSVIDSTVLDAPTGAE